MLLTLLLPPANYNLTTDDLPISLVRSCLNDNKFDNVGQLLNQLEVFVPYVKVFEQINDDWSTIEVVLGFLMDPNQPLTYQLFKILQPFIIIKDPIPIEINPTLFDRLNLSKLSTEVVVIPKMVINILTHPIIGKKAIKDDFKYPFDTYHRLVTNYDQVLVESCYQYSLFYPGELSFNVEENKEMVIMKTIDRMLKNKTTPRQYFINKGMVYLFYEINFKEPITNVYRDLNRSGDDVFIVKKYGATFTYRKDQQVNEIFDKQTWSQLNQLMKLDWVPEPDIPLSSIISPIEGL